MNPLIVAFLVFALNLPFGYWRAGLRKRSLPWFLTIHLPVPAVVGLRFAADLDWTFMPISATCFFAGQWLGGRVGDRRGRTPPIA